MHVLEFGVQGHKLNKVLVLPAKPQRYQDPELFLVLPMLAISVALKPAVALAVGLPFAVARRRGWLGL